MEESQPPPKGSLFLAEICEPFRRAVTRGAPTESNSKHDTPTEKKLHFCFHNWSRKGHATSLSHGPPRSGERETFRLVATGKCNAHWKDGRVVKAKIHGTRQQHQQEQQQQQHPKELKPATDATTPREETETPQGWHLSLERGSKWMAPVSGWVSGGGWIPSVGEKTPPPGYFQFRPQTTAVQRPLGAACAFTAPHTERVLPKTYKRPHSAMASMVRSAEPMQEEPEQSKVTTEERGLKRDLARRKISAEQRRTSKQKQHAKETVVGHVFAADFGGSTSKEPPWQTAGKDSPWQPDDPLDLGPVTVQKHVVDQTFRPCRHEGNMIYGPDRGLGEPEDRAQWLGLDNVAAASAIDIGPAHRSSYDPKGTIDFNHSLGHKPLADSAFGNLHIPNVSDSERAQITQPRRHGDDAPLRPRPDLSTVSFGINSGRNEAVNARSLDENGRVVVVEVTKAIGRNTDGPATTECDAYSHLLTMQTDIPSSFKCKRSGKSPRQTGSQTGTGRFRPLRKCVVR
eukprot:gnl/MRDRNA2_/MRDRNA2_85950_c3_seq19.p1 gnl/MRDRNA2_/MRDRNA2_85950_c3~~gnl/MRDRNA2_/MRDRNA2_85950_c3_seq19.p1  ORF type:complete len:513 (+),score=65.71 gnl/MRDRNA2_/MRDRNA2_85950_c3_seq19:68-1606(+)